MSSSFLILDIILTKTPVLTFTLSNNTHHWGIPLLFPEFLRWTPIELRICPVYFWKKTRGCESNHPETPRMSCRFNGTTSAAQGREATTAVVSNLLLPLFLEAMDWSPGPGSAGTWWDVVGRLPQTLGLAMHKLREKTGQRSFLWPCVPWRPVWIPITALRCCPHGPMFGALSCACMAMVAKGSSDLPAPTPMHCRFCRRFCQSWTQCLSMWFSMPSSGIGKMFLILAVPRTSFAWLSSSPMTVPTRPVLVLRNSQTLVNLQWSWTLDNLTMRRAIKSHHIWHEIIREVAFSNRILSASW